MTIEATDISRMSIKEGDVIVIKNNFSNMSPRPSTIEKQKEIMNELFPNNKCIFIDTNTDIEIIEEENK